jgi:hypothetical protein
MVTWKGVILANISIYFISEEEINDDPMIAPGFHRIPTPLVFSKSPAELNEQK